jgi:glutamine cyclotransferase
MLVHGGRRLVARTGCPNVGIWGDRPTVEALERVKGDIRANVWHANVWPCSMMVRINSRIGEIDGLVDLTDLVVSAAKVADDNALNGEVVANT